MNALTEKIATTNEPELVWQTVDYRNICANLFAELYQSYSTEAIDYKLDPFKMSKALDGYVGEISEIVIDDYNQGFLFDRTRMLLNMQVFFPDITEMDAEELIRQSRSNIYNYLELPESGYRIIVFKDLDVSTLIEYCVVKPIRRVSDYDNFS